MGLVDSPKVSPGKFARFCLGIPGAKGSWAQGQHYVTSFLLIIICYLRNLNLLLR